MKESILVNMLAIVVQAIVQFIILQKFLTSYSPDLYGEISVFILLISVFQIFSEGAVVNQVLRTDCIKKIEDLYGQSIVISILCVSLLYLLFSFFDYQYNEIFLIYIIISIFSIYKFCNQSKRLFKLVSFGDMASSVTYLVFILFTVESYGVFSIVYGQCLFYFVMCIINLYISYRHGHGCFLVPTFNYESLKNKDSLFQLGERFMNFSSVNIEKFIIPIVLGKEVFGIYIAAFQIAIFPVQKFNQIFSKVLNSYSKTMSSHSVIELNKKIRYFFLFFFGVILVLYHINSEHISSLLNSEWKGMLDLLDFLFVLTFLKLLISPVFQVLLSFEKYKLIFNLNTSLLCLNFLSLLIGVIFLENIESYAISLIFAQVVYFSIVFHSYNNVLKNY